MDLEEERQRNSRLEKMAPHSLSPEETEWETKKAIDDYKFKLQKAEQDINTLQTNVSKGYCSIRPFAPIAKKSYPDYVLLTLPSNIFQVARLESQVIRFKTAAETAERSEEELKTERRKMQREVFTYFATVKIYYLHRITYYSPYVNAENKNAILMLQLREATTQVEELETANKHLETRLGKLKTAKSTLLKEL